MLGVERAAIEIVEDGLSHSVRIGSAIDFEIEDIVPFGIETGEPVRLTGMSTRSHRSSRCGGKAVEHRCVRYLVRGQDGHLDLRVLLGRLMRVR